RNYTTYDFVNKLKPWLIIFPWPDFEYDIGEFTATTGLFLINFSMFKILGKSFFIGYLRCSLINFFFELSLHPVDNGLQMKFPHSTQNGLSRFLICMNMKCRILFYQFCNRHPHFIYICLSFW